MKYFVQAHAENSVYPGGFTLHPTVAELFNDLQATESTASEDVLVEECSDHYEVKVPLPKTQRDEIFISIRKLLLSIAVMHKQCLHERQLHGQPHTLGCGCHKFNLELPEDANPEFISAEFRNGILQLHIPKGQKESSPVYHQIVVY